MGASKARQFTQESIDLSMVARALAHPARIEIIDHLKKNSICRNSDLIPFLKLSKTTVHQHLVKLRDAHLIDYEYMKSSYLIRLNIASIEEFNEFVNQVVRE